jgi:hypothetical protein
MALRPATEEYPPEKERPVDERSRTVITVMDSDSEFGEFLNFFSKRRSLLPPAHTSKANFAGDYFEAVTSKFASATAETR